MRIFLIMILIFVGTAQCAVPTYGLRPSEREFSSEEPDEEEILEISKEKQKIIESVAPIREERERKLHPLTQPVKDKFLSGDSAQPAQYTLTPRLPQEPRKVTQNTKPSSYDTAPKAGINFTFLFLIALAFLLSYFFIQPRSK